MESVPPARRFFQLHLSTALVLMVLAAGFLGLNLIDREVPYHVRTSYVRGWPWILDTSLHPSREISVELPDLELMQRDPIAARDMLLRFRYPASNRSWRIIGNVSVALAILTLTAVLFEWRLRRRKSGAVARTS